MTASARGGESSGAQYSLLEGDKMLLLLVVHLAVDDVSDVHHYNDTRASLRAARNPQRAFPSQNGNNKGLSRASVTQNKGSERSGIAEGVPAMVGVELDGI